MSVTLRQLGYFLALTEEQNFGRAAQKMNISQPALSMQIKELEANIGVVLVDRLPREVRLTRAGREVAMRARRVLDEVAELESHARRHGLAGRLHLGVIPTVAPYLLPGALVALRGRAIAKDLRVREAQTEDLLEALERGKLDAIVIVEPAPSNDLASIPLFEDRFVLAGLPERLAKLGAGREALRPASLDPEQLLLLDEGHCLADQALEVCGFDRRRMRLDLGASSLATLCGLVALGFGLTFLPEIALAVERAAEPGIGLARFSAPEPARRIALVRRASTSAEGWFEDLAGVIAEAGQEVISRGRALLP